MSGYLSKLHFITTLHFINISSKKNNNVCNISYCSVSGISTEKKEHIALQTNDELLVLSSFVGCCWKIICAVKVFLFCCFFLLYFWCICNLLQIWYFCLLYLFSGTSRRWFGLLDIPLNLDGNKEIMLFFAKSHICLEVDLGRVNCFCKRL